MSDAVLKKRVGVLVSGRGSNMQALVEASHAADYPAEIVTVLSNKADAAALDWAADNGISAIGFDHRAFPDRETFDARIDEVLVAGNIDIVVLAGFMRILTPDFVAKWHGRMINIHPSLLPLFPGLNTHQRAIDAGMKVAGCTVHFVTAEMDVGPIISQAVVPVVPDDTPDTLAARVLVAEHQLYPQALSWVAAGDVSFDTASKAAYGAIDRDGCLIAPR